MSKKVDFKLNVQGLNQLMKSPEMQSVLDQHGAKVEQTANANATDPDAKYSRSIFVGRYVAISQVRADNGEAIHENLETNNLLKSLGQG